jgi:hypothetical protein
MPKIGFNEDSEWHLRNRSLSCKLLTGLRFPVRFRKLAFAAPFLVSDPIRPMESSAVTANHKLVTHWIQGGTDGSFQRPEVQLDALFDNPYRTHDLCPVNLCPITQEVPPAPLTIFPTTLPSVSALAAVEPRATCPKTASLKTPVVSPLKSYRRPTINTYKGQ